jgi:hypothetical protein
VGVGGVRGGGKRGGPGGARGPSGAQGPGKAAFVEKIQKQGSLSGTTREVGSAGAAPAAPGAKVDPLTSQALAIARQLRAGEISTRHEATRRLVADILKQKLRMQSKALTQKIADALQDDPRLNHTLDRLWSEGSKG